MSDNQTQAPPPVQPPPSSAPPPGSPESQARTWNMLCHLSALAGFIGVPFGNILGPLIVWLIKKNEIPSVDVHGKASLNFQISVTIAAFVSAIVGVLLTALCIGWLFVVLAVAIGLAGMVFAIIAGIKANDGVDYKYPWSLELVK